MKKIMVAILFGFIAASAQAGCGALEFSGKQNIVIRVDAIKSFNANGKGILINTGFQPVQVYIPRAQLKKTFEALKKKVKECAK